ncbi:cell filamentation protein [Thermoactinomyces sp. DSM 45891]|uniref:Fic/DOC family protein n=1 Tax=Thermoactinomyces sp. DSM 45891 TaxID=1761907 RepID=UPI0009234FA8|nr:Fic family protein [Thermoactinomyces sp. DSM 45891]SFX79332.1 cell filamentation protein [Thermoactinomyces sp. DSM 45891]
MTGRSKYFYPGTGTFINKADITDSEQLEKFERRAVSLRLFALENNPIYGKFNFQHLQKIHKYIFQDVYQWAGKLREEDISKGSTMFARTIYIQDVSKDLFRSLAREKNLKGLKIDEFCERAAYYNSEINMIHPFREGNGRTQREFIRTLALSNGYELNWKHLDKDTIMQATIKSITDTKDLQEAIKSCITNHHPDKSLMRFYQSCDLDLGR